MREKRYFVAFDDLERRIMVNCLNEVRTRLKQEGRYTDAVDAGDRYAKGFLPTHAQIVLAP